MNQICKDAEFILGPAVQIVKIVRWVIPILLIVLIVFDLSKTLVGQMDDKSKKDVFSKIVKRIVYAVIVFLIPTVVNFILLKIEPISRDSKDNLSSTSTSYLGCWNYYYNRK